jgi:translation initiation factor 2 alpha subunit (eIF-2alpha)
MQKSNISNISQTITLVEKNVATKAKKTLYLVLKKKGFADEVIDSIDKELEKRLIEYLKNIAPKLNEMKFDDPEKALECLLVKQMIKILDDMLKERMLNLKEEDKKNLFDLLKNEDEKKSKSP